jgi:hypothetical protein
MGLVEKKGHWLENMEAMLLNSSNILNESHNSLDLNFFICKMKELTRITREDLYGPFSRIL